MTDTTETIVLTDIPNTWQEFDDELINSLHDITIEYRKHRFGTSLTTTTLQGPYFKEAWNRLTDPRHKLVLVGDARDITYPVSLTASDLLDQYEECAKLDYKLMPEKNLHLPIHELMRKRSFDGILSTEEVRNTRATSMLCPVGWPHWATMCQRLHPGVICPWENS